MDPAKSQQRLKSWIAVTVSLALGACGSNGVATGPDTSATPQGAELAKSRGGHGLLICKPQPYTRVTQSVGPRGGTIKFGEENTLEIPAGALLTTVTISAEVLSDSLRSVRFEPHGLVFLAPVKLNIWYDGCDTKGLPSRKIAYLDAVEAILEILLSRDYPKGEWVSGQLWHFSRYAVAW